MDSGSFICLYMVSVLLPRKHTRTVQEVEEELVQQAEARDGC